MSFVWLTKESSAVVWGQMNNIATETLITNAGDLLKGPVEVRRQIEEEWAGNVWEERWVKTAT